MFNFGDKFIFSTGLYICIMQQTHMENYRAIQNKCSWLLLMPLTVLMNYPHIFLRKENEQAAGQLPGWYGFAFQC